MCPSESQNMLANQNLCVNNMQIMPNCWRASQLSMEGKEVPGPKKKKKWNLFLVQLTATRGHASYHISSGNLYTKFNHYTEYDNALTVLFIIADINDRY